MRINKLCLLVGWAISCFLFFEVAAHADDFDESSKMTFSQPVQIPGQTLAAGTYVFKLANAEDRNIVEIFSADEKTLYATVMTNPTIRQEATADTVVTFAEQGQSGPYVLLKWFYPGRTTGNEFIYPQPEKQQLAQDQQVNINATEHPESGD